MLNTLNRNYIMATIWFKCKFDELNKNELGISGVVAAVVLVLIAMLLVVLFWEKLKELVTGWLSTIETESGKIK